MRLILVPIAFAILLFGNPGYAFKLPDSFRANYRLEKYNTTVGKMTLELSRQDQQYIYQSVTYPYGLAAVFSSDEARETSTLLQDNGQAPARLMRYEFTRQEKTDKNQQINLDWSDPGTTVISGHYGEKKINLQHQGILWDRLSVQLALIDDIRRTREMSIGQKFTYPVINRDEIQQYQFSYQGDELIKLGKDQYNTLKLKRIHNSGKKNTILWLAKELDYIPVKVEQFKKGKLHASMELSEFSRQKP